MLAFILTCIGSLSTTTPGTWSKAKDVDCISTLSSALHIGEEVRYGEHISFDKWSVAKCQAKCASNTECKGFNYDNDRGVCRYKKSLSHARAIRRTRHDCWIYNRDGTTPAIKAPVTYRYKWQRYDSKQCGGSNLPIGHNNLDFDTHVNPFDCKDVCARDQRCLGFNFDNSGSCRYKAGTQIAELTDAGVTQSCFVYIRPKADRSTDTCVHKTCMGDKTCDWHSFRTQGLTCEALEQFKCDCTGCQCLKSRTTGSRSTTDQGTTTTTTRKRKGGCTGKCLGKTCDILVDNFQKSCETLEQMFLRCDCSGCKCPKPKPATCDGSKIGSSAQHTSERDAHASTGYEAPGQPVGTKLAFPCRQGYENGLVRYTCGGDGKFHTSDKCIKIKTTPGPWGVWHAYEPSGCPTACGSQAGSSLVGDVRCSTDRCDLRTKPKPKRCAVVKCLQPCKMTRLISLAGSGVGCTMAMLGIEDPCDCLCNFALAKIQSLESCAMGMSNVDIHDQWRACAAKRHGCGQDSGVVVVHGRRLRTA